MTRQVYALVEDPGAVNALVGLGDALGPHDIALTVYATGPALTHARHVGLACRGIDADASTIPGPTSPDAILVGTSENIDNPGFAWIDAARHHGIASLGFVDGPANAAYRFRGRASTPLAHVPDRILTADRVTKDAFVALGVAADRVHVVGHPTTDRTLARADALRAEGQASVRARLMPDIDATRPLVMFVSELSTGMDPAAFRRQSGYTLHGRGSSDLRSVICLEELLESLRVEAPTAAVVIRPHPKEDAEAYAPFGDEIDGLRTGGDPVDAVFAADLVVGMTSVLLYEAALVGRPVISVTPRAEEADWLPAISMGLVTHVSHRDNLRHLLQEWASGSLTGVDPVAEGKVVRGAAASMARQIADALQHQGITA